MVLSPTAPERIFVHETNERNDLPIQRSIDDKQVNMVVKTGISESIASLNNKRMDNGVTREEFLIKKVSLESTAELKGDIMISF